MIKSARTLLTAVLAVSAALPIVSKADSDRGISASAVFAMTNSADGNEIIAYSRNPDGTLSKSHTFSTGGRGSGGLTDPLESQGSLILSRDRRFLFAANAGSGDISVFRVHGPTLTAADRAPSGGSFPNAVAQHGALVYVLNAGGGSNVVGFRFNVDGKLTRIAGSTAFLTLNMVRAASLSFSPDGQYLVVTEKTTGNIDAFRVLVDGTLAPIVVTKSEGPGLFAALFAPQGAVLVSETGAAGADNASAISSYALAANGTLSVISKSVPTNGAGTCWQEVTPDGRFVYTSNSATSTISGFAIGADGTLTPLPGTVVATLPAGSTNLDVAISSDGKYLYTLNSSSGTVGIFSIDNDGTLSSVGDAGGLSSKAGINGIAAL